MRKALLVTALLILGGCATAPPPPLRVLVYNIHAGRDAARADNLERVASLIKATADVALLQEVDRNTARSGGIDQLARLMELTGMHGAFGKSLDYQGGLYGIATLSRWPISRQEIVPLRVEPAQRRAGGAVEPRVALLTVIETPGGSVGVLNTHFDASRDDTYRMQETEQLLEKIDVERPLLAGGDFNAEPMSRVHERLIAAGLTDAWQECGAGEGLTFPAKAPVKRIDYLFVRGGLKCRAARVVSSDASDHLPVVFELVP